jgi:aarF domain-containing kinase
LYLQVFSYIDPVPIASASIAQVHVAELRDSGKEVVLKVLKPGVETVLRTDLNFLSFAVKVLQALNPELDRLSLSGIVADIRASMLDEVLSVIVLLSPL